MAGALAAAGIAPGPQDQVAPALPTDVVDGDRIVVQHARMLTLVEGGAERAVWTTAGSVGEALAGLGLRGVRRSRCRPLRTRPSRSTGMSLELRVPRTVTLVDGTGQPQQVTTTASTVAGLLAERGIELGPDDVVSPGRRRPAHRGRHRAAVVRNGVGEVVETKPIKAPEQVIEDPELARGQKVVVEQGKAGEQAAVMRIWTQNGKEIRREQIRAGSSTPPQPRVVRLGTNDELAAEKPRTSEDGAHGLRRLDLGQAGQVRGHRQLVDQHRQRLLRRPAVRRRHLEGLRRHQVRRAAAPGQPRPSRSRWRPRSATTAAATAPGRAAPASSACPR